jgi:hypothetical protein
MLLSLQHSNQLSRYTTNRQSLPNSKELQVMSSCNSMQHNEHQFVYFSIQLYLSMLPKSVTACDPKGTWSYKHCVQLFIRCLSTQASTNTISTAASVSFYSTVVKHPIGNILQNVSRTCSTPASYIEGLSLKFQAEDQLPWHTFLGHPKLVHAHSFPCVPVHFLPFKASSQDFLSVLLNKSRDKIHHAILYTMLSATGCHGIQRYENVCLNMLRPAANSLFLFPTNCTLGSTAPTGFGGKLQPSSGN